MRTKLLLGILFLGIVAARVVRADSHNKTFSNKDIKGTYAEKFSGFVVGTGTPPTTSSSTPFQTGSSFPESATGTLTADGNGNFTAVVAFNIGGNTCFGTVAGTYQVGPDGTGTSTGTFTPSSSPPKSPTTSSFPGGFPGPGGNYACPSQVTGVQDEAFTIVGSGKIDFMSTDADLVASGTAQRQTHDNDSD